MLIAENNISPVKKQIQQNICLPAVPILLEFFLHDILTSGVPLTTHLIVPLLLTFRCWTVGASSNVMSSEINY